AAYAEPGLPVPDITRIIDYRQPAGPVTRLGVRILRRLEAGRRPFAGLDVVALPQLPGAYPTRRAVVLARRYTLAAQHPGGLRHYLGEDTRAVALPVPLKERRNLLHYKSVYDTTPLCKTDTSVSIRAQTDRTSTCD